MANDHLTELREQLAERILDLYKEILQYIIETICSHYRNQGVRYLRDLVKLDDWDGKLSGVEEAEAGVKAAAKVIGVQQTSSYLELLVNMRRSQAEDALMEKCWVSDMDADIELLQGLKDKLLPESYEWALRTQEYQSFTNWDDGNSNKLLWMRGDAGKGKTMLLMGIVEDLKARLQTRFDECYLSYFFCRGTNDKVNTATSVLRGLIWMLLRQEKSLIHHLDTFKGNQLNAFNDGSAFFQLKKVFLEIIQDNSLGRVFFVIDALDECKRGEPGLAQLLNLITETAKNDKVKWLLSSRNEPEIKTFLGKGMTNVQLSLEVNSVAVGNAVNAYIDRKVSDLGEKHRTDYEADLAPDSQSQYELECAQQLEVYLSQVLDQLKCKLKEKADGTFLWVWLVMKELQDVSPDELLQRIEQIPSGLDEMYTTMLEKMNSSKCAATCKKLLLIMTSAYRPLHLRELRELANLTTWAVSPPVVKQCGLLILGDYDQTVYFVHQSAKDYLVQAQGPEMLSSIFPHGHIEGHHMIMAQSLECMKKLKRDIYGLKHPGLSIDEIEDSKKHGDALGLPRYSCVYWADHLSDSEPKYQFDSLRDDGPINKFWTERLLYWIEALSLMRKYSVAGYTSRKLIKLLSVNINADMKISIRIQLTKLDSHRFISWARGAIESYPLQTYASALVFAPTDSLIRKTFEYEEPDWLVTRPLVDPSWNQCIQTLYGHSNQINSVACSPDGTLIASGSMDRTIRIWEKESGDSLKTLVGHRMEVHSVSFSPDGTRIASGSSDETIRIWDVNRGECLNILSDHTSSVTSVSFSPVGLIASASTDMTIKIWDSENGQCLNTIEFPCRTRAVLSFISSDHVAVAISKQIRILDVVSGTCVRVLSGHTGWVTSISTTIDGHIMSSSEDGTVKLWGSDNACLQTLDHHRPVTGVAMASNGNIISGSRNLVYIWDLKSGNPPKKMTGHAGPVLSVASTTDGDIVSCGDDETVRLWDHTGTHYNHRDSSPYRAIYFVFSPTSAVRIASLHEDYSVSIWDPNTGLCLQRLVNDNTAFAHSLAFSPHGILASGSEDGMIRIWDPENGKCLDKFQAHGQVESIAFSPDGNNIVCGLSSGEIQILNSMNGICVTRFKVHQAPVGYISVSACGIIASWGAGTEDINLCQTNGVPLKALKAIILPMLLRFSHDGSCLMMKDISDCIIWDTTSYECLLRVKQDECGIEKVSERLGPGSRVHYGITYSGEWITYEGEKVLWLPVEYRPFSPWSWAVERADAGNHLVISCPSDIYIYIYISQTPL